ncbi:MAG: hypothetical protein JKY09_08330 [Crocinitomicaceae bacterium]|nr:hypothetical protein [Crocinitomicaceae bacterium]
MGLYNKIMLNFWLFAGILIFIVVTYMGFVEGFDVWSYYYLFSGLALFMFFMRKWMIKRMDKHMKYLNEQQDDEQ